MGDVPDFDPHEWEAIADALDLDATPPPNRRPYPQRTTIAKDAWAFGFSQGRIALAFGVSQPAISNMIHGKEPWREVVGRPRKARRAGRRNSVGAQQAAPPLLLDRSVELWEPDDEIEPGGWWDNDEDEDEPEPAPRRARARSKASPAFGALTSIATARFKAAGYPVKPETGTIDWEAYNRQQRKASHPTAMPAPTVVNEPELPRAPDVRRAVAANPTEGASSPQRRRAPAGASEARVRLAHCGHVVAVGLRYGVPGAMVVCTGGCPAATRRPVVAVVSWR